PVDALIPKPPFTWITQRSGKTDGQGRRSRCHGKLPGGSGVSSFKGGPISITSTSRSCYGLPWTARKWVGTRYRKREILNLRRGCQLPSSLDLTSSGWNRAPGGFPIKYTGREITDPFAGNLPETTLSCSGITQRGDSRFLWVRFIRLTNQTQADECFGP